jgi:imidazolonepropionase-like amidohydrolase
MPHRLPCLLNDPPAAAGRTWYTGARLFDGTSPALREGAAVLVEEGRIAAVGRSGDAVPEGARVVDVGGRTLMPGLIDAHQHATAGSKSWAKTANEAGTEDIWPGARAHVVAQVFRELLRMGITTFRDVGGYDDLLVEARQAMRYGVFAGPRVLACGRIVSATGPGGRFFPGMYREADGCDEIRKAVREQMRYGADFIKVMTTGARSVELEDPGPAQMTAEEIATIADEAHRMGYRVAAHAEGLAGTEIAIAAGIDTIEHGMYLNQRPDLLERMAATGQVLVPTFGCFYGVAGLDGDAPPTWSHLLVELALHNLEEADRTLRAARAAGVAVATGHDWAPIADLGLEIVRMAHHGLTNAEALVASTRTAAEALAIGDRVGTVEAGKLADLIVVDGDPLERLEVLRDRERVWLVLQLGEAVAGTALEREVGTPVVHAV